MRWSRTDFPSEVLAKLPLRDLFLDAILLNSINTITSIQLQYSTPFTKPISYNIVTMVKLTEVEDEHYSEKPTGLDGEVLLEDDDDNYTDTGNPSPSPSRPHLTYRPQTPR
jgi:hypothetical protein